MNTGESIGYVENNNYRVLNCFLYLVYFFIHDHGIVT